MDKKLMDCVDTSSFLPKKIETKEATKKGISSRASISIQNEHYSDVKGKKKTLVIES